jgi:hypothetical protein
MEVTQVVQAGIKGSIAHPESAELIIDLLETDIATLQDLENYVNVDGSDTLEKIKLDTNPTLPPLVAGDIYYDVDSKTVAAKVTDDVTIRLSQDDTFLGYNIFPTTILKGQVVFVNGVVSGKARVDLARADIITDESIVGIAAEDIPQNQSGLIQTRGILSGIDTDAFFTYSTVYLSDTISGALASTAPVSSVAYSVAIGYVSISHASNGSIFITLNQANRLADLTDISIDTPLVDQVLRYNGAYWINGAETSTSASNGASLFLDASPAIPASAQSQEAFSLLRNPTPTAESVISTVVNNSTSLLKYFIYQSALGGTAIDAGIWNFSTYATVSNPTAETSIPMVVRKVSTQPGTVTIMGIGTSRTATAIGATPFQASDYNADLTLASYIQTPDALFKITGYNSPSSVSIETLTTYVNEISVEYSKHTNIFIDTPVEINNTTVGLTTSETAREAYPISASDKLSVAYYATTTATSNITVSLYINGVDNASYFTTPLVTRHNDLIGLQGGSSTERFHLTQSEYTTVLNTSGTNTGDQDLSPYELLANKSTSVVTDQASNTKYPSVKSVYDWATSTFQDDLGFTPENVANKATSLTSPDNTKYPTTQAVASAIGALAPGGVTSFNTRTGAVMPQSGDYVKNDVGLGNVDNTSDTNKPVSTAQAIAIEVVQDDLDGHKSNYLNPHNTNKTQVGLGNVVNIDTTTTANITDSSNKRFVTDAQLVKIDKEYFETVSKNLKTYPYSLNYTVDKLTSIVYDIGGGDNITKTLNYSAELLTTIVLSGTLPSGIGATTKTLSYSGSQLSSITYS